jgi:hypothetical protein
MGFGSAGAAGGFRGARGPRIPRRGGLAMTLEECRDQLGASRHTLAEAGRFL